MSQNLHKTLTKKQKEALVLINLGTFLEYFDLMLYIHMAVVLNAYFFPKMESAFSASLLAAFTFSMTYLFRPLGSMVFGFLGDRIGRKYTVVFTTFIMAISSFIIGFLPPYTQIGYLASLIVILCRIFQGVAASGEVIGAKLYVLETLQISKSYFYTSFVYVVGGAGGLTALGISSFFLFLRPEDGWRYAFFLGSAVAVIGSIARTKLKETPEFLKASEKKRSQKETAEQIMASAVAKKKNLFCYFGLECLRGFTFYFCFIQMAEYLKIRFSFSAEQIIHHNLKLVLAAWLFDFLWCVLARFIYPLRLIRGKALALIFFLLFLPHLIKGAINSSEILVLQIILCALGSGRHPADAIFIRAFPVIGRYTLVSIAFTGAQTFSTLLVSYGCVFLFEKAGFSGLAQVVIFMAIIFLICTYYFTPHREDLFYWRKQIRS